MIRGSILGAVRAPFAAIVAIGVITMTSSGSARAAAPAGVSSNGSGAFAAPSKDAIVAKLEKLNHVHPRLLASMADFQIVKQRIKDDPSLHAQYERLRRSAERILTEAPSQYVIPDGLRLLSTSRRVLKRVYTLSFVYRMDGDRRLADRAWQELQAAANFPDWNPRHFLDTAEMTHAFAIGYDWLYDAWTPEQRKVIRTAIFEKGLTPGLEAYRSASHDGWWVRVDHNWNQVCNGGLGMGALAIGDEMPAVAGEILHSGLESLPRAMRQFAPDGAWKEGPGYWGYATEYNTVFLSALQSALGTDYGLSSMPGFSKTGEFPIDMTGPTGHSFNYADGGAGAAGGSQLFWMAHEFHQPQYAAYEARHAEKSPDAAGLLWEALWDDPPAHAAPAPLSRYYRDAEVVTMRTAWDDPNAVFVAFKGGDNHANHSHLDLGSFVMDALGQRWVEDLGAENYNLPAYFGKLRWTYYRTRAEGHNTLVIDPGPGPDQITTATAKVIRFERRPDKTFGIVDLTGAYAGHADKVERGIALLQNGQVIVQDEISPSNPVDGNQPADIWWFLHTAADVKISENGSVATLSEGGQQLQVRLLSPAGAAFTVMDARPLPTSPDPEGQNPNNGVRKLAIHLREASVGSGAKIVRIVALLTPVKSGAPAAIPPIKPLADW